jgi:predicted TIM-barrel fold metal-dependent hydrolase
MIVPKDELLDDLACARKLQDGSPWMDVHVHPFEVIFNSFRYEPDPARGGVFGIDNMCYKPPSVSPLRMESDTGNVLDDVPHQDAIRASILIYRKLYSHIGPGVLGDQMALSGIGKCLLLPVLQPESAGNEEMELITGFYRRDDRFMIGYCIPNIVRPVDIVNDIRSAIARYGIKAIKLHPNLTGIDLGTSEGRERVEAVLQGCHDLGLPLVVHGGSSPVIKNPRARMYSSLSNLSLIDWGMTTRPVIISHAGLMGASLQEIESDLMPAVKKILLAHNNVLIDVSALDFGPLCLVLRTVDPQRIVFGSDSFYFSQWGAIIKLFRALKRSFPSFEERFLWIVSQNAARYLWRERTP